MPVGGADFAMLRALAAEQRRMAVQQGRLALLSFADGLKAGLQRPFSGLRLAVRENTKKAVGGADFGMLRALAAEQGRMAVQQGRMALLSFADGLKAGLHRLRRS